jgi:large-conductance mechanosensitive channel
LAFLVTLGATALAIDVMLMRASIIDDGDDTDISTDIRTYSFLALYMAEVFIANFIAFPICTFTVFSLIRPYQVKRHAKFMEKKRKEEEKQRKQLSSC